MAETIRANSTFHFLSPVRLHFERGGIEKLGEFAGDAKSVLIVIGQGSARRSGLLGRVVKALGDRQTTVFDGVEPNPSIATCEKGALAARAARADLVIGLGGGSAMDAAKVMAALAPNSGSFREEFGKPAYANPPLRTFAIPTTCGTGSEANHFAIITDHDADDKINFSSRQTYPELSILDPSVLDSLPREVLVYTAFDAFSHAFEGYTSLWCTPLGNALALEAMGLIVPALPLAAAGDPDAKANLLYASAIAGVVIAHSGTTMLHALGYYLTLHHGVPHGLSNAVGMPLLMTHLQQAAPEKLAQILPLFPAGESRGIAAVDDYLRALDVEPRFAAHGATEADLEPWAHYTVNKNITPRTAGAPDKGQVIELLRQFM